MRVFDSANPFRATHIIVHEVLDQHPWEACQNKVPLPQHCEFLTVPGAPCPCHSPVVTREAQLEEEEAVYFTDESDEDVEADSDELSPTEESDSESVFDCLDTPQDGVFRFTTASPPSKLRHEFVLEEDEEDLPPFDDWYQDIARRTA